MKGNFLIESGIALVLLVLLFLILNPLNLFMPTPLTMLIIAAVAVFFIVFAAFVWREKPKDERDIWHQHIAGRFAYLAGTTILTIGVIAESLQHTLDPWLIIGLSAMIIGKVIGIIYSQFNH